MGLSVSKLLQGLFGKKEMRECQARRQRIEDGCTRFSVKRQHGTRGAGLTVVQWAVLPGD